MQSQFAESSELPAYFAWQRERPTATGTLQQDLSQSSNAREACIRLRWEKVKPRARGLCRNPLRTDGARAAGSAQQSTLAQALLESGSEPLPGRAGDSRSVAFFVHVQQVLEREARWANGGQGELLCHRGFGPPTGCCLRVTARGCAI